MTLRISVAALFCQETKMEKVEVSLKQEDCSEWQSIRKMPFCLKEKRIDLSAKLDVERLEHVLFFIRQRKLKQKDVSTLISLWEIARFLDFEALRKTLLEELATIVKHEKIDQLHVKFQPM